MWGFYPGVLDAMSDFHSIDTCTNRKLGSFPSGLQWLI